VLFARVATATTRKIVLANLTAPANSGPDCLARHADNVQACSGPPGHAATRFNAAEKLGAAAAGARFVNVDPWFCAATCSSVIGNDEVYLVNDHVTVEYSLVLEGVLSKALDLVPST
jgi:hypothetical protein